MGRDVGSDVQEKCEVFVKKSVRKRRLVLLTWCRNNKRERVNTMKNRIKAIASSFTALILAFALVFLPSTSSAHGRPMPRPMPHRVHHMHGGHHHGHHRIVMPLPIPLPLPSIVHVAPPPARVWIPGTWVEERDIYGRIVCRRWIPGHWEYR